jgi:hypothetical protein
LIIKKVNFPFLSLYSHRFPIFFCEADEPDFNFYLYIKFFYFCSK